MVLLVEWLRNKLMEVSIDVVGCDGYNNVGNPSLLHFDVVVDLNSRK